MYSMNYMTVAPIPIFFLTLDRCFTLQLRKSIHTQRRIRRALLFVEALTLGGVYSMSTAFLLLELPLQYDKRECLLCLLQYVVGRKAHANPRQRSIKLHVVYSSLVTVVYDYDHVEQLFSRRMRPVCLPSAPLQVLSAADGSVCVREREFGV